MEKFIFYELVSIFSEFLFIKNFFFFFFFAKTACLKKWKSNECILF